MEPVRGVEPLTCGLRNRCSTTELHRLGHDLGHFGQLFRASCTPTVFSRHRSGKEQPGFVERCLTTFDNKFARLSRHPSSESNLI